MWQLVKEKRDTHMISRFLVAVKKIVPIQLENRNLYRVDESSLGTAAFEVSVFFHL